MSKKPHNKRARNSNVDQSRLKKKSKFRVVRGLLLLIVLVVGGGVLSYLLQEPEQKEAPVATASGVTEQIVHENMSDAAASLGDTNNWRMLIETEAGLVTEAEVILKQILGSNNQIVQKVMAAEKRVLTEVHCIRVPLARPPEVPIYGLATDNTIIISPVLFDEKQPGRYSLLLAVLLEEAIHLLDPDLIRLESNKLGIKEHVALELRPKILVLKMLSQLKQDPGISSKWKSGIQTTEQTMRATIQAYLAEDPTLLD